MRRIPIFAFIILFFAADFALASYSVRTRGKCLNLRSRATSNSSALRCVRNGSKVRYLSRRGNWYKVKVNGRTGYMYKKYVRKGSSSGSSGYTSSPKSNYKISANCLNMRSGPSQNRGKVRGCVGRNSVVKSLGQRKGNWEKVSVDGVEGWMSRSYLRKTKDSVADNSGHVGSAGTDNQNTDSGNTTPSGGVDQSDGNSGSGGEVTGTEPGQTEQPQELVGDFLKRFPKLSPHKSKRLKDLYQLPMSGKQKKIGPCGSQHIRGPGARKGPKKDPTVHQRGYPYMKPISACMVTGMAQDWKKQFCPNDGADCQLMFGDATYGDKKPRRANGTVKWPHKSHKRGHCIDIWPVRKKGHAGEVKYTKKEYDRKRTASLIKLMVKWGAEKKRRCKNKKGKWYNCQQFFFDDKSLKHLGVRQIGNHDGHIHVCFRENSTNRKKCNNLKLDPQVCPVLSKKVK